MEVRVYLSKPVTKHKVNRPCQEGETDKVSPVKGFFHDPNSKATEYNKCNDFLDDF